MVPIFSQSGGQSLGYDINSFIDRFEQICQEHLKEGRAKAFAFLFYNFNDHQLGQVIQDLGVFAKLDRLSGHDLSIFYLHSGSEQHFERFNRYFQVALGVKGTANTPCMVFFKLEGDGFKDVEVISLDNTNLINGFHELYEVVDSYIKAVPPEKKEFKYLKQIKAVGKFVGAEAAKVFVKEGIGTLFK